MVQFRDETLSASLSALGSAGIDAEYREYVRRLGGLCKTLLEEVESNCGAK
jgi:hypothetical protein